MWPQASHSKVRVLRRIARLHPHTLQVCVLGSHRSILTRSFPSFFAIHWALRTKSAKPRSPTFLAQNRCIAVRFKVSNESMSNWLTSFLAVFHCQSLRTLAIFL